MRQRLAASTRQTRWSVDVKIAKKFVYERRDRILMVYDRHSGYKKSTEVTDATKFARYSSYKKSTDASEFLQYPTKATVTIQIFSRVPILVIVENRTALWEFVFVQYS